MKDYSKEQLEEFKKLHQGVLKIRENLKTGFYLEKSLAQKNEEIMKDAGYLKRYLLEVPSDVKESYPKKESINISKLTEGLFKLKGEL